MICQPPYKVLICQVMVATSVQLIHAELELNVGSLVDSDDRDPSTGTVREFLFS